MSILALALASTQPPIPMTSFAGGRATGPDVYHSSLHLSPRIRISGYMPLLPLPVFMPWAVKTLPFTHLLVKDICKQTNQMVGHICPAMTAKCYECRAWLKHATSEYRTINNGLLLIGCIETVCYSP